MVVSFIPRPTIFFMKPALLVGENISGDTITDYKNSKFCITSKDGRVSALARDSDTVLPALKSMAMRSEVEGSIALVGSSIVPMEQSKVNVSDPSGNLHIFDMGSESNRSQWLQTLTSCVDAENLVTATMAETDGHFAPCLQRMVEKIHGRNKMVAMMRSSADGGHLKFAVFIPTAESGARSGRRLQVPPPGQPGAFKVLHMHLQDVLTSYGGGGFGEDAVSMSPLTDGGQPDGWIVEVSVQMKHGIPRSLSPMLKSELAERGVKIVKEEAVFYGLDIEEEALMNKAVLQQASDGYPKSMRMLLNSLGAHCDALDEDGKTALMLATRNPAVVEELLKFGASLNLQDRGSGKTALMLCAETDDTTTLECAFQLLAKGADVTILDNAGNTASGIAIEYGSRVEQMIKYFQHKSTPEDLDKLTQIGAGLWESWRAKYGDDQHEPPLKEGQFIVYHGEHHVPPRLENMVLGQVSRCHLVNRPGTGSADGPRRWTELYQGTVELVCFKESGQDAGAAHRFRIDASFQKDQVKRPGSQTDQLKTETVDFDQVVSRLQYSDNRTVRLSGKGRLPNAVMNTAKGLRLSKIFEDDFNDYKASWRRTLAIKPKRTNVEEAEDIGVFTVGDLHYITIA